MLSRDRRQPTLNICNMSKPRLHIIRYGIWYHKLDKLDNQYQTQTPDLAWIACP